MRIVRGNSVKKMVLSQIHRCLSKMSNLNPVEKDLK